MNLLQQITDPGIAPLIGAAFTAAVSIQTVFLKWLLQSFRDLRVSIDNLSKYSQKILDDHESQDQLRHEQNLQRFEQVAIALAKISNK